MMSEARAYNRSLSLPEDRTVIRSKSMSRSPNRAQETLQVREDHAVSHSSHLDTGTPSPQISPERSVMEGKSFLNRGKSMRETSRDGSHERRNFLSPSFYRSLRTKKENHLDPNSASSSKSPPFQRGVQRASSMRQKLSAIVKSPTKKLLKHSSPSTSDKNFASSSRSNVSLSPRILRPDTEIKNRPRDFSHRNSLPESIFITTIPEDGIEFGLEKHTHFSIHHDQFDAPEEKFIAATTTTTSALVRRSSLTGQLEHCYKSGTKIPGDFQRRSSEDEHSTSSDPRSMSRSNSTSGSTISLSKSPDKKSLKGAVILLGTETTV